MNILEIIDKKRNSLKLSKEEIEYVVNGYLNDEVKDYQMSSLLMAITINGMDDEEAYNLTMAMKNSGDIIDLSLIDGTKVDKHSTGGVGDKVTLIVLPIVASLGVKVAKLSGKGLGHTGGTIDKLESIENFKVTMTFDDFIKQIKDINVVIASQMGNLVPADKKIYALRDVTQTVSSIPLIASSIMSKKLASGADKIVIDLKVGKGALLDNLTDAKKLANLMISIGKKEGKEVVCILSNMDEPLGLNIGNALEVIEAIDILKGKKIPDLYNLSVVIASYMVSLGLNISLEEAKEKVVENIENGKAYAKFSELVSYQKGNIDSIKVSDKVFSIKSNKSGFISHIDTLKLGNIVKNIGAGRIKKDDIIDYTVGIVLNKKVGSYVEENEELLKVYLNNLDVSVNDLLSCFEISDKIDKKPLIYEVIK